MPDWLTNAFTTNLDLSVTDMAVRLGLAFLAGCLIAFVYRVLPRHDVVSPTFPPTLVLLAILCAMLPLVIGENVAWAFGLVGALSIVRFRTAVEDTQDITFVIFAVLVGMAVGAGHLPIAAIGIVIVGIAAFVVQPRRSTNSWYDSHSKLSLRVGVGRNPEELVQQVFERFLSDFQLVSGATGRQGSAIDLTYKVRLRPGSSATELIDALNRLDGMQSVELRGK